MAEQEESAEVSKEEKKAARQTKLKNEITSHIAEIQKLLDSLTTLTGKEVFQDADLEGAFDVMDSIREQSDKIEELLFSLRDTIR